MRCGQPVQLCGNDNEHIEFVPGSYMLGSPTAPVVVAGNVNVTHEILTDLPDEVLCCLGKCDSIPSVGGIVAPVKIDSTCATPVFVEVCNPSVTGLEIGFAPLGCVLDAAGVLTAKVFVCKSADDVAGATPTFSMVSVATDGTVTPNYTGAWIDCSAIDKCPPATPLGVLLAWG
jgi:hypothetical protein